MTPVLPVQELEARSLGKSLFLRRVRDVWDQLRQQKDLLANATELLSARSAEAEDLCLRCADMKAEAAMAREQVAPLAARVKELEEELTRVAGEWDALLSRAEEATVSAKAVAAQLGEEQGAHALIKGALDEVLKAAEASRVDALAWKGKYEGEFCSLYFACFFPRSAPNSSVWYRAGEGGFQGGRGLTGRGPALERESRG